MAKVPAAEPPTGAMDVSSRNRAGQSLAEFALVVPVLMLILLIVVDFGRAYMGWVQLNNAARVGANYAGANPTASFGPGSQYATLIANDASGANCRLPTTLPGPTFPNGTALGDQARVDLTCDFTLFVGALPGFGQILPNPLRLGATAYFPIRAGTVAVGQPGCTSGTPPTAAIGVSQTSGNAPLPVVLTDESTGSPTSWLWYFGDGQGVTSQGPFTHTYTSAGTYTVALTVSNACGSDTTSATITVTSTLAAAFSAIPDGGAPPLNVQFTDQSTGGPTSWSWTFGDGSTSDQQNPSHNYTNKGTYTVTLTITNGTDTASATDTVSVGCIVPNFSGNSVHLNQAQTQWAAASFTSALQTSGPVGNGNPVITSQSVPGGTIDPTCGIILTVTAP